jgi:hypothetical protein
VKFSPATNAMLIELERMHRELTREEFRRELAAIIKLAKWWGMDRDERSAADDYQPVPHKERHSMHVELEFRGRAQVIPFPTPAE